VKIAYLISHDINTNDGVTKKILGQTSEWKNQGHKVEIYCFVSKKGNSILTKTKQYEFKGAIRLRLSLNRGLLNDLNNFNPDIVYFRYDTWSRTLSKILNKYKVIAELNSYDLEEFWLLFKQDRTIKSFLRYLAYKFLRSVVLSRVSGIIGVTKEISKHLSNIKFNKPTIYIPNGIDLKKYSTIKNLNNLSSRIGLFFIGTPNQPWHGVDIIERISRELPQYDFHIVGVEGESSNNLFWHGYLQRDKYLKILEKTHLCIGSLALHRINMQEACPLKVREYLAYGYPIIIGYQDTSFIELELPSFIKYIDTNLEIDIESINTFIDKNINIIIEHDEINFLSTQPLEEKRLRFFNSII